MSNQLREEALRLAEIEALENHGAADPLDLAERDAILTRQQARAKEAKQASTLAGQTPDAWAKSLKNRELLDQMQTYLGTAALPYAVGQEIKRRFNALKYGRR